MTVTPLAALTTLAATLRAPLSQSRRFEAAGAALEHVFGWTVMSMMRYDADTGLCTRLYSTEPAAWPVGGTKPRKTNGWSERVYDRGEIHIGSTAADIQAIFDDHAVIASFGCASIMNLPIRYDGRTLGAVNLMDKAHRYDQADHAVALAFAGLMIPLVGETGR